MVSSGVRCRIDGEELPSPSKDGVVQRAIGMEHQRKRGACIPSKARDVRRVRVGLLAGHDVDAKNFLTDGEQGVPRPVHGGVKGEPFGR